VRHRHTLYSIGPAAAMVAHAGRCCAGVFEGCVPRQTSGRPVEVFDLLTALRFEAGNPLDGARQRYVGQVRGDSITGTSHTRLEDGRQGRRPFAGARAVVPPFMEGGTYRWRT